MKLTFVGGSLLAASALSHAALVDTTSTTVVAAFQAGAIVQTFDGVSGRTPQSISSYTAGDPVSAAALVYDQFSNVKISVGGTPGTDKPALYKLTGGIAGDASSGDTVLGSVDFDGTTKFNADALLEIYFPTQVSKVGFWLNPALGSVLIIAADTNFAFSGLTETILESSVVDAGHFVGFDRATSDIGGFKIIATSGKGFSIDDFTYSATSSVPEPATYGLLLAGLAAVGVAARRRRA